MKTLGSGGGFGGRRWLDAGHFLAERTFADFKKAHDIGGRDRRRRAKSSTRKWRTNSEHHRDAGAQPSPDGKWIAFLSDRDGWDHVYVMPGPARRGEITKGKFESGRAVSPDSTRIAFDANELESLRRSSSLRRDDSGRSRARDNRRRHHRRGTDIVRMVARGTRLAFQHTDPHNSADIWTVSASRNRNPQCRYASPIDAGGRWIARPSSNRRA